MAVIPSTPTPTTTHTKPHPSTPAPHKSSPSKPAPSAPHKSSPSKPAPSTPKKKDDTNPVIKAATEGAVEVQKAVDAQPTPERKIVVGAYKTGEAAVKTAIAGAGEVVKKAVEIGTPIAKKVYGPTVKAVTDAGKEIADAAGKFGDNFDGYDEIGKAWNSQPTIERQIVAAGYEAVENTIQGVGHTVADAANVVKEVGEGAIDIALHNPAINATKEAAKGVWWLGGKAKDWVSDRISGGVDGAVKATKTASNTISQNWNRTIDQWKEDGREIGEAAGNFGDNFDGYSEIGKAWNSQPTIERQVIAAGYEAVENTVQGAVESVVDAGNVVKEVGEAAVEDVVTGVKNTGNAIAGGFEAAGDFIGGIFG